MPLSTKTSPSASAERLVAEMKPLWLRIGGYWYPRGGIPIDVFWQIGRAARGPVGPRSGRGALSRPGLSDRAGNPRIVVHGAGSVGCYVGGAWLAAGLDVAFLGRARVRDEIAEHGLTLSDTEGWHVQLQPDRIRFETEPKPR